MASFGVVAPIQICAIPVKLVVNVATVNTNFLSCSFFTLVKFLILFL
mgnify:CR=1 FL=1